MASRISFICEVNSSRLSKIFRNFTKKMLSPSRMAAITIAENISLGSPRRLSRCFLLKHNAFIEQHNTMLSTIMAVNDTMKCGTVNIFPIS